MQCPVCKNTQLVMAERQNIEIDYCPNCRGVWLDRGELDKIIERAHGDDQSFPGQAEQSWGHSAPAALPPLQPVQSAPYGGQEEHRFGHGGEHNRDQQRAGHGGYSDHSKGAGSFLRRLFD
ncbi:TFIIB-type zinc ribbon-containing protein [Noviherbaspirillum galbum]|uniref:Recombination protein RecR n=1 Tax=Noviherbaspirillum galbum TaxID=2709383 RepID=A0A6B3SYT3_9BURK|nr:zf-TFIIB domain-containing protein [Noviherbaspirillum galbum]NEX63309.1 recombination protein RecR [Noviherbaspirillum galbum]